MIELNWVGIVVVVVVCLVMFAIGWGLGYRIGFTEGDGQWRKQLDHNTGVAVDRKGNVVKLSPKEQEALDRAVSDFRAGKPANVDPKRRGH